MPTLYLLLHGGSDPCDLNYTFALELDNAYIQLLVKDNMCAVALMCISRGKHLLKLKICRPLDGGFGCAASNGCRCELDVKRVRSKSLCQLCRHLVVRALLAELDRVRLQRGILAVLGLEVDNDTVEDVVVVLRNSRLDVLQRQLRRSIVKKKS